MTRPSYFIAGCGHFGSRAAIELLKRNPASRITAIDWDEKALQTISSLPVELIPGDCPQVLSLILSKGRNFDYLIPCVPFHFAFEFILLKLGPSGARRADVPVLPGLPNVIRGKTGDLYTSVADFLCSEDCPEPPSHCMITGEARRKPLYERLMELQGDFESRVIPSHLLAPGVGGIPQKSLLQLIEEIKRQKSSGSLFLISTASRCHGVTSALRPPRGSSHESH